MNSLDTERLYLVDNKDSCFVIQFFIFENKESNLGVTVQYLEKNNPLYLYLSNLDRELRYKDIPSKYQQLLDRLPFDDFYLDMAFILNWFSNKDNPFTKMGIFPVD